VDAQTGYQTSDVQAYVQSYDGSHAFLDLYALPNYESKPSGIMVPNKRIELNTYIKSLALDRHAPFLALASKTKLMVLDLRKVMEKDQDMFTLD